MKRFLTIFFMTVLCVAILCTTAFALTEKENNDTAGTAQSLTLGETIEGEITEKDVDFYRFTLKTSGKVTLDMTSYMRYYCLYLYDQSGTCLWQDEDNEWNSTVGFRNDAYDIYLEAGTYTMKVTGYKYDTYYISTGTYALKTGFTSANATEKENNNSYAEANSLQLNGSVTALIGQNDRYDFFKLTLSRSGRLTLDMTSYMRYYCLYLYDLSGTCLWQDEDNEWNSTVGFRNDVYDIYLEAGTYTVKVTGYKYDTYYTSTGTYTLKTGFTSANATEKENNNSHAEANSLQLNGSVTGLIGQNDRYDFFKLTLSKSGCLTLDMTSYMRYYCLYLYDQSGTCLWVNEDNEWNSTVGFRKDVYNIYLEAGTYTVKVTGYKYDSYYVSTGTYTLKTAYECANATETEPNNVLSQGNTLLFNEANVGVIAINDEFDFYKLQVSGEEELTITMRSYMRYYTLHIYDIDGKELWGRDMKEWDSAIGYREDVYSVNLSAGTYFIRVTGYRYDTYYGSTGTYELYVGHVHSFSPWSTVKEATYNSEGLRERYCSCGKVESETIPMLQLFNDVANNAWYRDAVLWAVQEGVTSGVSSTMFAPDRTCTRAQVVTFLWRAAGEPTPKSSTNPFTDVSSKDYYYKAVLWAVEKGITTGMTKTTFAPDKGCTRGQVVTFLYRFAKTPGVSGSNAFKDVLPGAYYYEAVLWAVKNNITTGVNNTSFAPDRYCTRAQIVTFLYRYLG